jgi:hypothetical protein
MVHMPFDGIQYYSVSLHRPVLNAPLPLSYHMLREVLKDPQKGGSVGRGRGAPWRKWAITMKESKKRG